MFFPRLRSQAKWAFVLLIVVFAGGFVFLGVGSGGLDLGSLIRDAFGRGGSSTPSVSKAEAEVRQHPLDPAARKDLATSLEQKGRVDEAILAWTQYTKLRPKDVAALRRLAQLQLGQADTYLQQAQQASLAQQEAGIGSPFTPNGGRFGQALGQNPISSAVSTKASAELQQASSKYQTASTGAIATYKKIVKLTPTDQQAVFALAQAADSLRQTTVAISAYKRLLKFNLDPTTKAQIRARIQTLQASGGG
jgi:tetratricopeptide (TPR) repeat protein